jgi:protein involved in polysaccharide export with SLBB domain
VNRPNTYELRPGDNVLSLLTQGGGTITDFADLRRAYLQRANSRELIPIDLYSMLIRGDTSQNYPIEDGDALIVPPETQNHINIQGKVQSPGQYPYREPMTLADAISLARGDVPYRSRMSKIVIARQRFGQPGQYIRIDVDFVRFVRQGDQTQNVVLQPGDFIYVPETNTPDFNQISALANVAYIFNNVSGLVGFKIFK